MTAMNLGDSNLRFVNTSKPQLVHANSKQSITASDDYYSLESLTSEGSSNDDRTTVQRYETPPMHMHPTNQQVQQSEATTHTPTSLKTKEPDIVETKMEGPSDMHTIPRKPVSSSSSEGTIVRRPVSTVSPPTPGVDDTPYIQFAIDQLTRDEEVAGTRRQSNSSEIPHPVERIMPNQYRDTRIPHPPPIPPSDDPRLSPTDDVLLLPEPMAEVFRHPKLQFVPWPLRTLSLIGLIFCCLLMMTGLAFCGAYPLYHNGLRNYDGSGTSIYFVFQYLPQILSSVIILWLLVVQSSLHRIYPFVALASGRGLGNSGVLHDAKLYPTSYLIPNFNHLRHGGPWLAMWAITFWLAIFTVPLQSCLFQTRFYPEESVWRWTSVQPVAWLQFTIYAFLVLGLGALLLRFSHGETGLKWDPTSLADIMAIFHRSNILNDFQRSEIETAVSRPPKDIRLGYWRDSRHEAETFYCIGDENAPARRYSLEHGRMRPVNEPSLDLEAQTPRKALYQSFRGDIHNPVLRYRWVPWFLKDTFVVAWIVIAVVLLVAFLVLSFVNQAAQVGFLPQLPSPTSAAGFSPADFLYSFIPSLLGMILFLAWQPFDTYFRAIQPFASLSRPAGSSVEDSLLLDYTACLPLEVSLRALLSRHFKVAWISFVGLSSITLPILAGGVFTAQYIRSTGEVRTVASMPGYEALVVFLIIYALSFLVLFPTRKRYLPHDIGTLSELVSFFYQSPLLAEAAFKEPRSKIDLVTRLVGNPADEKTSSRFAFGIYMGQDGREHLGIDRLERPGYGQMRIDLR